MHSRRPPQSARSPKANQGSVLIVALLFAGAIAFVLGSYMSLGLNSLKLANRTFYNNASINLVETGIEEAVWSFNRTSNGWSGWDTSDGVSAKRTFSNFTFGGGATGAVKTYVDAFAPSGGEMPKVVAEATITLPGGQAPVKKWVEVTLRRRSLFANGLVAKDSITFNGNNASVDSWNSDPDNDPSTPPIPYSTAVRNDAGSVGSTSVLNTAVSVNNADIWGYASTGGAQPQVGNNGSIKGEDTPSGVKVDANRVSTDFIANFDPVTAPTGGTFWAGGATIGTTGTTTLLRYGSSINSDLTVYGNVTLVITVAAGADAIKLSGNTGINIGLGSSLIIYTDGDVAITGNGVANDNPQPITFQLWGTSTSSTTQKIDIKGNGDMIGIVYAPNAAVKIAGNGQVMGSVVAKTIVLDGNADFHYDESLANFGSGNPYGIVKWRELTTAASRAVYASALSGW